MITLNFKEIYWIAATATIANIIYHEESKIKLKKKHKTLYYWLIQKLNQNK